MLSDFRPEIQKELLHHLMNVGSFEHARILEIEPGHSKIAIEIREDALNIYGNVHGGFLFSLCDAAACMAAYAYEISNVTQSGSIQYLRGASFGTLYIEANAVHKGTKTAVIQIEITDDRSRKIAVATFTIFFMQPV